MNEDERLKKLKDVQAAFQDISVQALRIGIHNHPQRLAIVAAINKAKPHVDALMQDAAKAEEK